ncbi:MAG TPA: hypothetical protein VFU02_03820 [Polyangiaceae bacterium]|nr:hypothetical protein [Polyangiaceae bacterium]
MGFGIVGLLLAVVPACGGSSTKDAPAAGGAGGMSDGGDAAAVGGSGAETNPGAGAIGGTGAGGTGNGGTGAGGTNGEGGSGGGSCGRGGCILPTGDSDPIDPPGPVYCGGVQCAESEVCCLTERVCFDPERDADACPEPPPDDDTWGRKACASNAHCGDKEFCSTDGGCTGVGHCQPISNCGQCFSDDNYCRVCGCDGNTYPDQQTACLARTSTVAVNAAGCGETVTEGGGGFAGAGGAGGSGGGGGGPEMVRVLTPCANDAQCPDEQLCCTLRNLCYPADTPYLCEEPPAGTTAPCLTDADCRAGEYCWGDGCTAPGGCVDVGDMAEDCGVTLDPVCGCDGTSYTSAACADQRGVRIASDGECADE